MKKKDKLKLTNIKDEIIDRQSEKRYRLMSRKHRPKWILTSSLAAAIVIALMVPIFMVLFSKQVPIYEGMSVLSEREATEQIKKRGKCYIFI